MSNLCLNCALKSQSKISFVGDKKANILIVGDTPTFEEVSKKRPFINRDNRIITELLKASNIDASKVVLDWKNDLINKGLEGKGKT